MDGFLSVQSFVIITGASRGYGAQLAKSIVTRLKSKSTLILASRPSKAFSEAISEVSLLNTNDTIKIKAMSCDLSKADDIDTFFEELAKLFTPTEIKSAILINNAGTLGNVSLTIDKYDHKMISEYFELNVSNAIYFTKKFLDTISSVNIRKCVVNITSLSAIKPFPSCGLYSGSKAARDMMFKVLAAERNDLMVLSWAPGPMPTDMLKDLANCADKNLASAMTLTLKEKTYVECKDSAEKLFLLLETCNFTSGDHIDYYDI